MRRQLQALFIVAALAGVSCGGSTPTASTATAVASTQTGVTSSAPSNTTTGDDPAVATALTAAPTVVHPLVNAAYHTTATITTAGGDITLELPSSTTQSARPATATLHIPAGALAHDTAISLLAVDDLDSSDGTVSAPQSWDGVEIRPSGLMFAPQHVPTLTFTGIDAAFVTSTWGWDADGVVDPVAAKLNADGSVTMTTPHFSGYGGGDTPPTPPSDPMTTARNTIGRMLGEEQAAQAAGTALPYDNQAFIDIYDKLHRTYVLPLLRQAAQQCGPGLDAALRAWLGVEQGAQLFGGEGYDLSELGPVVHKMLDCARADCKAEDPTAGGRFMKAWRWGALLGVLSDTEQTELGNEMVNEMQHCTGWHITAVGNLDVSIGEYPLNENFSAQGDVKKDGESVVPMHVTTRNAEAIPSKFLSVFAQGLGNAMGVDVPSDAVQCNISQFGPSAARIVASTTPGVSGEPTLPSITFGALVAPAKISCGSLSWDDPTYLVFLMPAIMNSIGVTDLGFQHHFTAAEFDGFTWSYSGSADVPGVEGISGSAQLLLQLVPIAAVDQHPAKTPATTGLHDWGSGLRAALA